ncbi:hypothetical protein [Sinosporangium siamense]|nr:hypothetical protein [Sinosporangium siamense]
MESVLFDLGAITSSNLCDRPRHPRHLTWPEADPARHPFAWDEIEKIEVTRVVAAMVPPRGADQSERFRFLDGVTDFLVTRYGRWACGWNWSVGEADVDGGVVTSWCCRSHWVIEPDETAEMVAESLVEWRGRLEDLAERFADLASAPQSDEEHRSWHVERATVRLVTVVVDRSQAESAWYGHREQVLRWFLTSTGVKQAAAEEVVEAAIGGRFHSWVGPERLVLDAVGTDLAVRVTGRQPYSDR